MGGKMRRWYSENNVEDTSAQLPSQLFKCRFKCCTHCTNDGFTSFQLAADQASPTNSSCLSSSHDFGHLLPLWPMYQQTYWCTPAVSWPLSCCTCTPPLRSLLRRPSHWDTYRSCTRCTGWAFGCWPPWFCWLPCWGAWRHKIHQEYWTLAIREVVG